jgi:hypothetical protein
MYSYIVLYSVFADVKRLTATDLLTGGTNDEKVNSMIPQLCMTAHGCLIYCHCIANLCCSKLMPAKHCV